MRILCGAPSQSPPRWGMTSGGGCTEHWLERNRGGYGDCWRLLLDSRVVILPMAYNPNFVILSFLTPLFFKSLKNELGFSDNAGV